MSKPTEHKTVQARILEYAEAIGWTLVSQKEAERRRDLNHKERREHKEDLNSESLSSLCSLRYYNSDSRGLNRKERKEHKERKRDE